jgi:serine/threonine protein kinase
MFVERLAACIISLQLTRAQGEVAVRVGKRRPPVSIPDAPSDDDVAPATSLTQSSSGKRGSRKSAQRGILPIGFVLNGIYEVKRFIARGGMGEVYEGVNVNAEERVAVKVILPHLAADPKVQALFRKEAKTLTSLAHPALVQYRVLAREPRKDLLYIVTDFIDGEPLTNLIGRNSPTTAELAMLTRRLAEGLHAAHSHGAIHRDISPENVLLPDGVLSRAKIIDFGIAKSMEIGAQTVVGDGFAGKLGYVAPEQFGDFDRRIGPWTDVYSLGLVVLALAGGRAPDMGTTLVEAIDRRRAGADLGPVPPLLQPLFLRMLTPDPRGRPQTMAEVISALDALDIPFEPPSPTSWSKPPVDASAESAALEIERTVIHFGSEPPSWQSAEPRGEDSLPPSLAAIGQDAIDDAPPEARTIFVPPASEAPAPPQASTPPTTEEVQDALPPTEPEPASASTIPPVVSAPVAAEYPPIATPEEEEEEEISEAAATIFAPPPEVAAPAEIEPDPSPAVEKAKAATPRPSRAAASTRPGSETTSAAPPAMDFVYKAPDGDPGESETATRRPLNGKLVAGGVAAAVVVVGLGFALLSSQKKPDLPPVQPAANAPATPNALRAEQAIATALPTVPCSWLTVSRGQSADGSGNIKVSGTAGDPVAANRTVASAAQSAGASGLQIDTTEILQADQASCPLLDTVGKFAGPRTAAPSLLAQQARFEIDRGIQGCPTGLWAQSMITVAPDPAKGFSLIAIQPNGRLQQFAANRDQFTALASRNPDLYKDLGGGRYRVSMCQNAPGLSGVLMIEGAAPFDIGLRPGALERPKRDFAAHLRQVAQEKGWTMQMAWFQVVNDQPDLPDQATTDEAARHRREMLEAQKAAAAQAAAAAAAPPAETVAPVAEAPKLPADHVACRRFVGGAWEELGYATRAACTERVFAGRCDVLSGQSGDIALRRYGDRLQAKTGKGFNKWSNVGKSDCAKQ